MWVGLRVYGVGGLGCYDKVRCLFLNGKLVNLLFLYFCGGIVTWGKVYGKAG